MKKIDDKMVVAFQGMPGAYSNMACIAYFNDVKTLPCNSFEDMLKMVMLNMQWYLLKILWPEELLTFII